MTDAQHAELLAAIQGIDTWSVDPAFFFVGACLAGFWLIFSA